MSNPPRNPLSGPPPNGQAHAGFGPLPATPDLPPPSLVPKERLSEPPRVSLGPLPPRPRLPMHTLGEPPPLPALPPETVPELPPHRGRLPTRDEIADHFIARPPSQAHASFPARVQGTVESLPPLVSDTASARLAPIPPGVKRARAASQVAVEPNLIPLPLSNESPILEASTWRGRAHYWTGTLLGRGVAFGATALGAAAVFATLWIAKTPAETPIAGESTHAAAAAHGSPRAAPADVPASQPGTKTAPSPQSTPSTDERDARFAVRTAGGAVSCDTALGEAFVPHTKPSPGRSSAQWSRSRRSLLTGREAQALTQMCESARWDLAGRGAFGLVEYYFQASDFEQALQWAERIPAKSSRYLDARGMVGDIHNQRGHVQRALRVYADTWNFEVKDSARRAQIAEGFLGGAEHALDSGDSWTAERFARRAAVIDPSSSRAALTLARAFGRFGLHNASAIWSERARELAR